jgi:hypothetical protein
VCGVSVRSARRRCLVASPVGTELLSVLPVRNPACRDDELVLGTHQLAKHKAPQVFFNDMSLLAKLDCAAHEDRGEQQVPRE